MFIHKSISTVGTYKQKLSVRCIIGSQFGNGFLENGREIQTVDRLCHADPTVFDVIL
jgi:hypothetical protein